MNKTTDDLIALINENHAKVVAKFDETKGLVNEHGARLTDIEQKIVRRGDPRGEPVPTDTLGAKVVASAQYKHFKETLRMTGTAKILVENAITSAADSGGPISPADQSRRFEPIAIPRQRLFVRNVLGGGKTTQNMVEYTKQSGRTNNAAVVSEGALKPESSIEFSLEEAPVRTIATWIPASRQIMDDAPRLRQFLDTELRFMIAMEEEDQILFGSGAGQNLQGLSVSATTYAAPFAVVNPTMIDVLLLAIAQAEQSNVPADAIIVNSLDWRRMQSFKDSQDRYIGAGPFGAQPNVAWSLPVVATPAMPAGDFMAGNFGIAAELIDRQQTEVLLSTEDRDNFIRNMVTVLAEERVALAVKIPEAIVYGEYGNVSG